MPTGVWPCACFASQMPACPTAAAGSVSFELRSRESYLLNPRTAIYLGRRMVSSTDSAT